MANVSGSSEMRGRDNSQLQARSSLFVVLGMVYVGAGSIAIGHLAITTIVTVYYVGAMMVVAGVGQVIHAFQIRTWSGFIWWLLAGFFYAGGGAFAFLNPLLASSAFTLALAVLVIGSGMSRALLGFHTKPENGWGWIVASGVVSIIVGLIFLLGWPANSLWLLGLILAADLIFQGCTFILFGMGLKPRS